VGDIEQVAAVSFAALADALVALGGQTRITSDFRAKGDDFLTIETALGPEVWARDGIITCVSISNETDD
jgi:hypothetical protein